MKPWSLQNRLLALLLLPTGLLIIGLGIAVVLARFHDLDALHDERSRLLVSKYANAVDNLRDISPALLQQLATGALEEPSLRSLSLLAPDGSTLLQSGPLPKPLPQGQAIGLGEQLHRHTGPDSWQYVQPLTRPVPTTSGALTPAWVMLEFGTSELTIRKYEALLLVLGLGLASLIVLGTALARQLRLWLSPIDAMAETLHRIDSEHLEFRLDTPARGDLAGLQSEINALLDRIGADTEELKSSMVQANEDLRETMEAMEVQNIELTLARKEAVEGNRIKSEFLANISHEIRTPLNGIMGFAKLLLKTPLAPRQLDYVRTIQNSSDSLVAIINDVIDLSKIEAGKLVLDHTPLDIEEVIFEVLNMLAPLAEEKDLEQVAFIYDDVPRHLMGDPLRLKQILTNLVNNAIKFTPKGDITVRCMLENQTERHAIIRITVTDTGIGLSDSARADLFRAFSQGDPSTSRKYGGTGLGLVISRHLVQQMHGEINFDSNPEGGTTFWFTLRADLDTYTQSGFHSDSLIGRELLVAEPHDVSRHFLVNTVEHWGAHCRSAQHLAELQELLKASPPDALIVGLSLLTAGGGNTGSALRELRQHMAGPIVLLARSSDSSQEQASYQGHLVAVLSKPVAPRELHYELSRMFSTAPPAPNLPPAKRPAPLRILAVDDNPANLKLVCTLLEDLQVTAVAAPDGHEAIRLCQEKPFDLVFMDIQMPGINGLEATQAIRQHEQAHGLKRMPIIALTAHAMANERDALLKSGMDDYMTKPVQESQLAHVIGKWTGTLPGAVPRKVEMVSSAHEPPVAVNWTESVRLAAGKTDLARDMLLMLLNSLEQERAKILGACEDNHMDNLLAHVHYLHGATRYCGVPLLRDAAHTLETRIKTVLQASTAGRTLAPADTSQCRAEVEALMQCIDELIVWRENNSLPA
ncbi:MAG: response regulator [Moraxellaceae bacterium]|nr:response regulator [Moraxellaceae bacterium]